MADHTNNSSGIKSGCGLLTAVFGRKPRRSASTGSIPTANVATLDEPSNVTSNQIDRIIARPGQNYQKPQPIYQPSNNVTKLGAPIQGHAQKVEPQGTMGLSGELENIISDHQKNKGASTLVRASSGNVMLYGNLGNIRQPGCAPTSQNVNPSTTANEQSCNGKSSVSKEAPVSLCRALSTRMDPEKLKDMGNEDYKNGRFEEALALYDAAISIDPNKASYRSNKAAALTALGRLIEAVFECREAVRIEPFYHRAHHRLSTLYLRLGEAENAMYHHKQAGSEADPDLINKAKKVLAHLSKCTEAKRLRDWNTLLIESGLALCSGADSAPQILALKVEAMIKLQKHQEADETLMKGPKFEVDHCIKFLGPIGLAGLLVIWAQVHMAAGRFDDAVKAADRAVQLDSNNKEANIVVRKARAVAMARSKGNELFKSSKFSEASVVYSEGLDQEPYNAVLLCNRATCSFKLGQFEKAIEDCTIALKLRPSYSKARQRRADCNAKMEKWEACIEDYETLMRENIEDEEVKKALKEAQIQLTRTRHVKASGPH